MRERVGGKRGKGKEGRQGDVNTLVYLGSS